ncbi:MAG: hypothetical protein L6R45_10035 [Anaerolineae bacterium]|nr:hypothetical protein [Anaerolineae bacterium]
MPLATLLAHLANYEDANTVIDPMCGIGDMLAACSSYPLRKDLLLGIEIDPLIHFRVSSRFGEGISKEKLLLFQGNAFDVDLLTRLPCKAFDLVITNPPYIRYQELSRKRLADFAIPTALEIRNNLLKSIQIFPTLDKEDKRLFAQIISSYSGLSDLAVPAWILCAMLTKINGRIAMVVPETWLSRDYAQIIQYLLLRWFKIEYVVEDAHATWFSDAQVKTTLLVAKRIDRLDSTFAWTNEEFLQLIISPEVVNNKSIVGNLFPDLEEPEKAFVDALQKEKNLNSNLIKVRKVLLRKKATDLRIKTNGNAWLNLLENVKVYSSNSGQNEALVPYYLTKWLEDKPTKFYTLERFGIQVSQGLRTGANKFFYVDIKEKTEDGWLVKPNSIFGIDEISVPEDCLRPVLRKQSELGNNYTIEKNKLGGGVLALQNYALLEDIQSIGKTNLFGDPIYSVLPEGLSTLVKVAAKTNIGTKNDPQYIPDLSAVKPNVRGRDLEKLDVLPRFWYMLPPFTRRHSPDLFVPRVNNLYPRTLLNPEEEILIDANFSTIWKTNSFPEFNKYTLLAILNSSWCIAAMEEMATVMGGGALKLEATHLRKIPIPIFTLDQLSTLSIFGQNLAEAKKDFDDILRKIDIFIIQALIGEKNSLEKLEELRKIKLIQLHRRAKTR